MRRRSQQPIPLTRMAQSSINADLLFLPHLGKVKILFPKHLPIGVELDLCSTGGNPISVIRRALRLVADQDESLDLRTRRALLRLLGWRLLRRAPGGRGGVVGGRVPQPPLAGPALDVADAAELGLDVLDPLEVAAALDEAQAVEAPDLHQHQLDPQVVQDAAQHVDVLAQLLRQPHRRHLQVRDDARRAQHQRRRDAEQPLGEVRVDRHRLDQRQVRRPQVAQPPQVLGAVVGPAQEQNVRAVRQRVRLVVDLPARLKQRQSYRCSLKRALASLQARCEYVAVDFVADFARQSQESESVRYLRAFGRQFNVNECLRIGTFGD